MNYRIAPTKDDLTHSWGPWKKHKYISVSDGKYRYPDTYGKTGKRYGYTPGNDDMQTVQKKVLKKSIKEDKRHNKISKRINKDYNYDMITVLGDNHKSLLGNKLKQKFRARRETKRHEKNERKIAKYAKKSINSINNNDVKKGKGILARLFGR